jgi:predicted nucleic acid-binding protein
MLEQVLPSDLEMAWLIGERFEDQEFSPTDRTSFALMERLRIQTVASFDNDFAIYRFGLRGVALKPLLGLCLSGIGD